MTTMSSSSKLAMGSAKLTFFAFLGRSVEGPAEEGPFLYAIFFFKIEKEFVKLPLAADDTRPDEEEEPVFEKDIIETNFFDKKLLKEKVSACELNGYFKAVELFEERKGLDQVYGLDRQRWAYSQSAILTHMSS